MTVEPTSRVGRPRDPDKHSAVLEAARELLAEGGYAAATISAIARRAEVGTPTIYRRWPRRETLIEDAVFGHRRLIAPAPGADLHATLTEWVRMFLSHLAEPATRAAIPGLLVAYQTDADLYRFLLARVEDEVRTQLTDIIGSETPLSDPGQRAARADAVFDTLVGITFTRALTFGSADIDDFCQSTADTLVALTVSPWAPDR